MKRWIVYLLPLLLCACQGDKMRRELQRVDSLNSCDALLDTITTMPEVVDYFDLCLPRPEQYTDGATLLPRCRQLCRHHG